MISDFLPEPLETTYFTNDTDIPRMLVEFMTPKIGSINHPSPVSIFCGWSPPLSQAVMIYPTDPKCPTVS